MSLFSKGAVLPKTLMHSTTFKATQQSPLNQGIQGNVRQLSGDHMPRDTDESPSNNSSNSTVQTKIWIFAARIPGNQSPRWSVAEAEQYTGLVCQVETNHDGYYSAALPAGEYTIFAQYGNDLYLNAFQSNGDYMSVEVVLHKISEMNIIQTESAFF